MNMKLIAGLAVAITLASAMTFTSLLSASKNAPEEAGAAVAPRAGGSPTMGSSAPAPYPVSTESNVTATLKVGGDVATATVEVVPSEE